MRRRPPWPRTVEEITASGEPVPPPGRGSRRTPAFWPRRSLAAAMVLVASAFGMAVVTASVVGLSGRGSGVLRPSLTSTAAKLAIAGEFADLGLPTDPDPTPAEIGDLVVGLGRLKLDIRAPCDGAPASSALAAAKGWPCLDHTVAFAAARRGLTEAERSHIARFLDHPGLAVIEALARAEGYDRPLDLDGGEGGRDGRPPLVFRGLALPRLVALRRAGYVKVAAAALRYDGGDPDGAEIHLRELVSAGRVLVEDGPTLVEALVGSALAGLGLEGLIELYEATGRSADGRRIARRMAAAAARTRDAVPDPEAPLEAHLRWMEAGLADPDLPRGARLQYALLSHLGRTCSGARAVLLGPPAHHEALMQQLVRDGSLHPADRAFLAAIDSSIRELHDRSTVRWGLDLGTFPPPPARWTAASIPVELSAALLANPRIDGCYWLGRMG